MRFWCTESRHVITRGFPSEIHPTGQSSEPSVKIGSTATETGTSLRSTVRLLAIHSRYGEVMNKMLVFDTAVGSGV